MGSKYRICVKMTYNKSLPLIKCEKNPKEWRIRRDNFEDQIKKNVYQNIIIISFMSKIKIPEKKENQVKSKMGVQNTPMVYTEIP